MHTYIHTYIHIYIYIYTYIYTYIYLSPSLSIHTRAHTHTYICIYMRIYIHIYTFIYMYISEGLCPRMLTRTPPVPKSPPLPSVVFVLVVHTFQLDKPSLFSLYGCRLRADASRAKGLRPRRPTRIPPSRTRLSFPALFLLRSLSILSFFVCLTLYRLRADASRGAVPAHVHTREVATPSQRCLCACCSYISVR